LKERKSIEERDGGVCNFFIHLCWVLREREREKGVEYIERIIINVQKTKNLVLGKSRKVLNHKRSYIVRKE